MGIWCASKAGHGRYGAPMEEIPDEATVERNRLDDDAPLMALAAEEEEDEEEARAHDAGVGSGSGAAASSGDRTLVSVALSSCSNQQCSYACCR